jgi:hypothetical protein
MAAVSARRIRGPSDAGTRKGAALGPDEQRGRTRLGPRRRIVAPFDRGDQRPPHGPVPQARLQRQWRVDHRYGQALALLGGLDHDCAETVGVGPRRLAPCRDHGVDFGHAQLRRLFHCPFQRLALDDGEQQPVVGFRGLRAQQRLRLQQRTAFAERHDAGLPLSVAAVEYPQPVARRSAHDGAEVARVALIQ